MLVNLKEIREYEGFTQEDVAKILNVKRSTYAGWESGKDPIPLQKLNILANYYHTSLDYLIGKSPTKEEIKRVQEIDKSIIAKNIKNLRKEKNLTQEELADKITTSQSNIHKYENEKSLITTYYALEFCKQYEYSLDTLVGRDKKEKTTKH